MASLNPNDIPTLASAMRTAAQSVTGERVVGAETAADRHYAMSRVGTSVGAAVSPNMGRYAQMAGTNTTVTAPNFYSPFLTPSSFQIPNARKEVYLWANWWRNNEPKIAAAINFYTNYPFSGWELECSSSYVKDYFEKLVDKLNFQKWLPEISKVYHLLGDCFVLASIDCKHCGGTNIDPETGEACKHDGATWGSLSILNPDSVMKTPGVVGQEGQYAYVPSVQEMKIVNERSPKDLYDAIPPEVRKMIAKGEPIKLNPISIHHFKFGSNPWEDFGSPMIRPLFPTLAYKDKLRQAQWLVAERHILPIKVVKVGSDTRPASQDDIDSVHEELASIANDPNLMLVTHHAFDFDYVGASGKVLQLTNEFEMIDQEILDGVMLNKALLNGEGPTYGNAQVGLLAMAQRLDTFRREVARWVEQKVFKPIAEWNGFTVEGERGQEEIVFPTIKFADLQLRDDTGKLQMLVTANSNGVISNYTLIEAFGYDADQEIQRLREEQGAAFVANPGIGNTDMMNGFAGGMGGGFGGGMPAMPGMGMGMPPMGAPPMGMPPMGGAPGGLPPLGAETARENYRTAAAIVNNLYEEKRVAHLQKLETRLASKNGIKSEAHRVFMELHGPATGRAGLGPLPEEYDGLAGALEMPLNGGWNSLPMNSYAAYEFQQLVASTEDENVRTVLAAKKKKLEGPMPQMFTSLEKTLYYLLGSLNLPFAIYAQFQAGPSMDYQLDAAIPQLKLGIEADGEIWHNSPDKISRDKRRDMELAANGWTILRFTDAELTDKSQQVMQVILQAVQRIGGGNGTGGQMTL